MLAKNALLEEIAEELSSAPPINDAVIERFFSNPFMPSISPDNEVNVGSFLAELWLKTRLEELAQNYRGRIVCDPVQQRTRTKHYL
ncbi:MAG: hypothetical protein AABY16_00310 [Nanoarchaeota archaeon]